MSDYDKLGSFYLGKRYDMASGQVMPEKLLYKADNLTTHAVCVGMTGSGKTGLCLSLIEEAALDGIPTIAIDPKGDLGNLLLAFPELRPEDFEPWVDPAEATRLGISKEELAQKTAETWKQGLAQWDENEERIRRFNAAVDKVIYTPGSSAGLPLTVLKGFHAPPSAVLDDADLFNDLVQSTVQGVLALVGIDADPVQSREAILIANVLSHSWRSGKDLDLAGLIHDIQAPPFTKVGIVDLENFLPASQRLQLGMKINNLLASPSFASWLEGDALNVESLLCTESKQPRLSIISIAHLNDAERMFFVTILLNEVLSWIRSQPGTSSLRAILYMDEVFGFFPPTANPPSKRPMLTLLKQARAYGLGVVLATQNPVDLDYKGLSNAGTWFLGRLQTERDKLRVLEGLESASDQAGSRFDRSRMDASLSGLKNRVFIVNNVHQSGPEIFQTRWAMSYLRGPLTREQIRTLMAPRKSAKPAAESTAASSAPKADVNRERPLLSGKISQKFWPLKKELPPSCRLEYRPALTSRIEFVFGTTSMQVFTDVLGEWRFGPAWDGMILGKVDLETIPGGPCEYAQLPGALANEKNYKTWAKDLEDWFEKKRGTMGGIDERIEKTKAALAKAELKVVEHKWWWMTGVWSVFTRGLEILLIAFTGGRSRKQLVTKTTTTQVCRGKRLYAAAQAEQAKLNEQLGELELGRKNAIDALRSGIRGAEADVEKFAQGLVAGVPTVGPVELAWLPWKLGPDGTAEPLY